MRYQRTKRSTKPYENTRTGCVSFGVFLWIFLCWSAIPVSAQQRARLQQPLKNPSIVVLKSKRKLELYTDGSLVRVYKIGLGLNPVDDKKRQGDRATPEGDFYIFTKNNKSAFYLSLGISYPNIEDAERGLRDKIISRAQHNAIVR